MTCDAFPGLFDRSMIADSDRAVEITRFCVTSGGREMSAQLFEAGFEWLAGTEFTSIIAVFFPAMLRVYKRAGWVPKVLNSVDGLVVGQWVPYAVGCQKHPWTNRATLYLGNTRSGVPGRLRRYRRNRSPNACAARRTRISGCVFLLRTRAIVADRCSRLIVSAIGPIPTARTALPHILATLTLCSAGLPHKFGPLFKILRRIANPCTPVRFRYSPPNISKGYGLHRNGALSLPHTLPHIRVSFSFCFATGFIACLFPAPAPATPPEPAPSDVPDPHRAGPFSRSCGR